MNERLRRRGRRSDTRPQRDQPAAAVLCDRLRGRRPRPGRRADRPAAELLSETGARLDAVAGHRLSDGLQFSLDHQAGLRRLFRFRAAVRLSAQELSGRRQHRRDRRLSLGHAALLRRATSSGRLQTHRLCHGDLEHGLRRRAGGERAKARRERPLRQPAMALVQRRRHGQRHRRRRS